MKYKIRRLVSILTVLALVLTIVPYTKTANAAAPAAKTWTVNGNVKVYWSGEDQINIRSEGGPGEIPDYQYSSDVPWKDALPYTTYLVIQDSVTRIGKNALGNLS